MENIIEYVGKDFLSTMKDEGFETFAEMRQCYWWTKEDIQEEVHSILNMAGEDFFNQYGYLSDDDCTVYARDGQTMAWGTFIRKVAKYCNDRA